MPHKIIIDTDPGVEGVALHHPQIEQGSNGDRQQNGDYPHFSALVIRTRPNLTATFPVGFMR